VAERRRHPRKKIIESQLLTAEVALASGGPVQPQRGIVIDLSEGGMAVQPFLPLAVGAVGELYLELPGAAKALSGQGMVAWVGSGGRAGIRFIDMPADVRTQVRAWLMHPDGGEVLPPEPSALPQPEPDAENIDFQAALQLIAERAQVITGASGAAIAIGDLTGMVCHASCGNAPDIGVNLTPGRGLSGYCLGAGEIVYCADTQSDLRVDAAAARQLGLGSIIIVPVFTRGQLSGLLEVLAPRPNSFNPRQMTRLERFSELLGAALEEHRRGRKFPNRTPRPASDSAAEAEMASLSAGADGRELAGAARQRQDVSSYYDPTAPLTQDTTIAGTLGNESSPASAFSCSESAGRPLSSAVLASESARQPVPSAVLFPSQAQPPAPAKVSGDSGTWYSCMGCGHQNPPWATACENCHRMLAAAAAAEAVSGKTKPPAVAEMATLTEPLASLSSYAAPSRAGRLFTVGVIVALLLCLIAGWYVGRAHANKPGPTSAIKTAVESKLADTTPATPVQVAPASPEKPADPPAASASAPVR
jgi:GAF domain-containing protein